MTVQPRRWRRQGAALLVPALLMACSPSDRAGGLPTGPLHDAIAASIGDPSTCVLLAEGATGKVVYRYGESFNCVRGLPACDRPGRLTATQALSLARAPGGRAVSCPSNADASRMVGWSEGRATSTTRDLIYSATMEGERALPGHEIAARLDGAFRRSGL